MSDIKLFKIEHGGVRELEGRSASGGKSLQSQMEAQLEQACPGVSREMLRRVLGDQKGKSVECIGRGPGAKWIKKG